MLTGYQKCIRITMVFDYSIQLLMKQTLVVIALLSTLKIIMIINDYDDLPTFRPIIA